MERFMHGLLSQIILRKGSKGSEKYELAQFISLFNSLESVYGNDCKNLLRDNKIAISNFADEICGLLDKNKKAKAEIEDIFCLYCSKGKMKLLRMKR